ncbi:MAG: isopentenyl phosphate kinase [Thermoplasmata archaeon]
MQIIKFGGSVITNKAIYRRARIDLLGKLCERLTGRNDIILVHGAGSFGHIMALKYGLERPGKIEGKEEAISRVTNDVSYLNNVVVKTLIRSGVPSVGIPPHAIYSEAASDLGVVKRYQESGIIPVLYGDVIIQGKYFRIISGDEIIVDLSREFRPERVVFLTDVDGLYTADPKTNPKARLLRNVRSGDLPTGGKGGDATGAMSGKLRNIREMMKYTESVVIINGNYPERLGSYLQGRRFVGTVIT